MCIQSLIEIVQKLTDVLSTWLTNHIKLEDFKFVEYLKKIFSDMGLSVPRSDS